MYMIEFVNDKQYYINQLKELIIVQVIKTMEILVSIWYKIFLFIGGELELLKCRWYLIDWKFDSKDKPFMKHPQHILFINTRKKGNIIKTIYPQYTIKFLRCYITGRWLSKITTR